MHDAVADDGLRVLGCGGSDGADDASDKPEAPCEEQVWFMDQDADGFGDPYDQQTACEQPDSTVDNGDDCSDDNPTEFPGPSGSETWTATDTGTWRPASPLARSLWVSSTRQGTATTRMPRATRMLSGTSTPMTMATATRPAPLMPATT